MLRYVAGRVLAGFAVLLVASAVTFALVDRAVDPTADLALRQPPVPQSTIDGRRSDLYLDRPVVERYWLWLTGIGDDHGDMGILQGRWGPSTRGLDIGAELGDRFVVSMRLVLAALSVGFGAALVTATAAAARRGSRLDRVLTGVGSLGLAVPTFWLASVVKEGGVWLNERVGHRVLFTLGATSADHDQLSTIGRIGDVAGHLVLPTVTLAIGAHAVLARHHRAAVLEVLDRDHVTTARAKGLGEATVLRRHVLRNALVPTTTVLSLLVAGALTGVVIIERTFRWRGMGTFLLDAVGASDPYAILGFLVVATTVVVVSGLVADLLAGALDPRIRCG